MKSKYILKGLLAMVLVLGTAASCDSYNEAVLTDIGNTQAFSPFDVTAQVRNQTNVELDWMGRPDDDHYVVEFSADDTTFATIFKTVEVTPEDLPVTVALEGETLYSIRVKTVSKKGIADSKWTIGTVNTLSEQLFLPIQEADVASKEATVRWIAGSNVTQIVLTPGSITHVITDSERAAGVATITGLTPETMYQVDLFNNTKKRGATTLKTGIDIGNGTLIKATDDLLLAIENAADGAQLFLEPGNYIVLGADKAPITEIILKKSITISGLPGKEKPKLNYKITINSGALNVSLLSLNLDGTGIVNGSVVTVLGTASNYGDILLSGCEIRNYERALINGGNVSGSKVNSVTVENCLVERVNTTEGSDFIDFRATYVASISIKNSTFNTCSAKRDFVRVDAAGLSGTGLKTNVLIEGCTLYNVSNSTVAAGAAGKRILYLRFVSNSSAVRNTIIAGTAAVYNNNIATELPIFADNNYFEAVNFKDSAIKDNRIDIGATTLNPGFANAATGDFTISNQSLKDKKIGDPRWIK